MWNRIAPELPAMVKMYLADPKKHKCPEVAETDKPCFV